MTDKEKAEYAHNKMDKVDSKLLKTSIIINIISLLLHLTLAICKDKISNFSQTYTSNTITVILFFLSSFGFVFLLSVVITLIVNWED